MSVSQHQLLDVTKLRGSAHLTESGFFFKTTFLKKMPVTKFTSATAELEEEEKKSEGKSSVLQLPQDQSSSF